jgi:hypothetical protein
VIDQADCKWGMYSKKKKHPSSNVNKKSRRRTYHRPKFHMIPSSVATQMKPRTCESVSPISCPHPHPICTKGSKKVPKASNIVAKRFRLTAERQKEVVDQKKLDNSVHHHRTALRQPSSSNTHPTASAPAAAPWRLRTQAATHLPHLHLAIERQA